MRLLYFAMHGNAAEEFVQLCQRSGVQIDVAGTRNRIIMANTSRSQQAAFHRQGVGCPSDLEIALAIRRRGYDAIIVSIYQQIYQFYWNIRAIDGRMPLIVSQGNCDLASLRRQAVENVISPSPRALAQLPARNRFLIRKLVPWEQFPDPDLDPTHRAGFASYINHFRQRWPSSFARLEAVNQRLEADEVVVYGEGSDVGIADDVIQMARSRATVHLKGDGMCCNAVIRSMALGTPVVMDRETFEQCYFDNIDGLLVRDHPAEMAAELDRLAGDNAYWRAVAESVFNAARRQFVFDAAQGSRFIEFLRRAVNRGPAGSG